WINWTWTSPPDEDFNFTMVYLNGTWQTNTSDPFYNATGLNPDTYYEIGTHTVDNAGNINETWVNQTTKTKAGPDTTPPTITFVSPTPTNNSEVNVDYVFVNVTLNENGNTAILNGNGVNETMLGAETNFYLNKTDLSTGAYVYKVYANDTANIWNVSETRVVRVNVTLAKPDLEITAIWCELLREGKKATYYIWYNITNNGGVKAGRSVSNLTVDGVEQKKKDNVKPLAAGETRTEFFRYRYRSATAPSTIMVCADYNNKIVESNETNNCCIRPP
ncbi:MAG: CARDB domain-containing protein, partial [Halobacteriota archaeon]